MKLQSLKTITCHLQALPECCGNTPENNCNPGAIRNNHHNKQIIIIITTTTMIIIMMTIDQGQYWGCLASQLDSARLSHFECWGRERVGEERLREVMIMMIMTIMFIMVIMIVMSNMKLQDVYDNDVGEERLKWEDCDNHDNE